MKKIIAFLLCLLCTGALLCGCSKTVSKDQILEDIREKDYVYDEYDLTITDYSESRYEGNKDKDIQEIDVVITAENDIFEYTCSYKLRYVLYDDGWRLKLYADEIVETVAKEEPDLDDVKDDFRDYFGDILDEYNLTEEHFGKPKLVDDDTFLTDFIPCRIYTVSYTGSNDLLQMDAQLYLGYQLDHDRGWVISADKFGQNYYEHEITVLVTPDQLVDQLMADEGMDSYEITSVESDGQTKQTYFITAKDEDHAKYTTMIFNYEVVCSFDEQTGWSCSINGRRDLAGAECHTVGTWLYDDGTGDNIYRLTVYEMTTDSITMSYDLVIKTVYDDETRYETSDGIVTMRLGVKEHNTDMIQLVSEFNIAGPEGKGAGSYRLRFFTYSGDEYEKSGFYIYSCQLKKIS